MKNYIEGAPLNDSDINNITPEMQKQLGVKVAEFVAWMDTDPWHLLDDTYGGYENYLGLMWHLQDGYEMAKSCETERNWIIGHQDLYPDGNLIFKDNELIGVIDFGNTGLSTPESELRHLAIYGNEVLEPSIRTLEERTDYKIDKEYVSLLADLQNFVNVVFRASRSRRGIGYDLRLNYLQERYPNFELPDLMR